MDEQQPKILRRPTHHRSTPQGGYIGLPNPPASLTLLKPLAEEEEGLSHAGDTKMTSLKALLYVPSLAWIEQVAECKSEE